MGKEGESETSNFGKPSEFASEPIPQSYSELEFTEGVSRSISPFLDQQSNLLYLALPTLLSLF